MLKKFKIISIIEGLSLIALIGIAMPLKYYMGYPMAVTITGSLHGFLWIAYLVMSLTTSHQEEWSVLFWLWVLLLSVIPFGFLVLDFQLKKKASANTSQ